MKNASLRIAAIAAALAVAAPAAATNGMRMIGFGPVQNSMGGAAVAAPLDAATVVTNPAGLSAVAPRVDLAAQAFMPSVKYDASWSMGAAPAPANQESDRPTDFLPTVAGVFKLQDKLTLGVAALGVAGMGVDYAASPTEGLYGSRTYTSYSNMRFAPAAAYKVNDALSVGLAANLSYAWMKYEAGGQPLHDTAYAFGYGATVGVTYAVNAMVTLGAAYETQSSFQDFSFDLGGQTQKLAFDQPQMATVGAAVRPVEGLLVAADVEWINWSATNGENKPEFTQNAPPPQQQWNMNWSDQWVVKVGAEYAVAPVKGLKVRAGYDYGKSPLDETRAFENVAFPAIAEHHFTLGAGYDAGKLAVNVAGMYSPETKLQGANPTQQGIMGYEVTMSQLAVELGATYRF